MPPFSFPEWYARMGYHRHGGQKACAEALGITPGQIRHMLSDPPRRRPNKTLVILCKLIRFRECSE